MTPFEWLQEYDFLGGWMTLEEFFEKHGFHAIIECDEGPIFEDELVARFSKGASVEYLGEESPYYIENDGLYFIIRPLTKKGTPRRRGGTHVIVYP